MKDIMQIGLRQRKAYLGRYEITVHVPPMAEHDSDLSIGSTYVHVKTLKDELIAHGYPKDSLRWVVERMYDKDGNVSATVSNTLHRHVNLRISSNMPLKALFVFANIVSEELGSALTQVGYTDTENRHLYRSGSVLYMGYPRECTTVLEPAVIEASADDFITEQLASVDASTGLTTTRVKRLSVGVECRLFPQLRCSTQYDDATLRAMLRKFSDNDNYVLNIVGGTVTLSFRRHIPLSRARDLAEDFVREEKRTLEHLDVLARAKELLDQLGVTQTDIDALKEVYNADGVC